MHTFNSTREAYDDLNAIVEQVQPNFIIFDMLFAIPVGKDKGIPWANLCSAAMSFFGLPGLPVPQVKISFGSGDIVNRNIMNSRIAIELRISTDSFRSAVWTAYQVHA